VIYTKRVLGCINNSDLFPEKDIEDALESLNILSKDKMKLRFFASSLFSSLVKLALDFTKEMAMEIRKVLVLYLITNSLIR